MSDADKVMNPEHFVWQTSVWKCGFESGISFC